MKVTKNVFDFLFRKWFLIIRFPSKIKNLRIDPVFLKWVDFIKNMSIISCIRNSKIASRPSNFSSEFESLLTCVH